MTQLMTTKLKEPERRKETPRPPVDRLAGYRKLITRAGLDATEKWLEKQHGVYATT